MGSSTLSAMRVGDDDPVRIDRRRRIDRKILHPAIGQHHADGFGLLLRGGGGDIGVRDQRAVDDAALAGAGACSAGKRLQQPGGAALGGGRKRVVADFDGPGALADRDARQRRLVLRIQPPLRQSRLRRERKPCPGAQAENERDFGRNGACGGHVMRVPGSARANGHLGRNILQTTRVIARNTPPDRMAAPRSAGKVLVLYATSSCRRGLRRLYGSPK